MTMTNYKINRGDIYYADLGRGIGSEQNGKRPVLVIQNNIGNKYSPTVIVASITSQMTKAKIPTHVKIDGLKYGLPKDSIVLLEQIRTIDKRRLEDFVGRLDNKSMNYVDHSCGISIGLTNDNFNNQLLAV
ncbi:type II toxin-antitoxin system PemK/MazF family toxin [Tissierella praeacuta]|uniref:type II toxin-antitoxin system PemK/MazF family toxin n=1 Tax=Tissierella praeacuta TaxID=43131 RepID=UPI003DA451D3